MDILIASGSARSQDGKGRSSAEHHQGSGTRQGLFYLLAQDGQAPQIPLGILERSKGCQFLSELC